MQQKTLIVAIAALLPAFGFAQDTTETLDTVLVESVYAVPAERDNKGSAVTILNEEDFAKREATYVTDVLKTVPGIALGATGGHGAQTSVFMRGANSDQTLVIIDGVRMNPVSGGGFNFGTLPLSNVERIEVLRGEQSALWGSDAIGGVINITTKSGQYAAKPFNADINIGAGSNGTVNTAATLYGREGGLYYAINASSNRTDGISSLSEHRFNYTSQAGTVIQTGGATEKDKFRRGSGSLRLGYEFDNAGIEVFTSSSRNTVHFDPSNLANEASQHPFTKTRDNVTKLSGYWGSADDLIRQSAYISQLSTRSETQSSFPSKTNGKKRNAGYQIDFNFDREGKTTQGVSGLLEYQKNSLNTNNFAGDRVIKQSSVALEYRLFDDADHAFSAGIRHDNNSEFDNDTTYRVAGGYRISDHLRLHASVGTGIKNPTIYEYYGFFGNYQPNPSLKPEKSRGGDIGLSLDSRDGRHNMDVTYFNRRTEDLITANADFTQSININGTSKASGVEVTYSGDISEALSTYANYTYTKTEDANGKQLARRPEHQASAGLAYQINHDFGVNANVLYVGKRLDNYFDSTTFAASAVDMPSYTVVNLGADYQLTNNLNVYLNINNAFDKAYENVIGFGQPERTFYIGIKGNW